MKVLVIAEHNGETISAATHAAITAAQVISREVVCLVVAAESQTVVQAAARIQGVSSVQWVEASGFEHRLAEPWAELIAQQASDFTHVMMASTTFGKNCLPRAAALVDAEPVADVIQILSPTRFQRPVYAGDILQTVESEQTCLFLTIRATAFDKAAEQSDPAPIEQVRAPSLTAVDSRWVSEETQAGDRPELASADIVFSGGRGLQNKENFERLQVIADRYRAAMGASRAAVDAGLAPNDWQVGQTGQVVAPSVYVALGISGATQHLAGMKDSKTVIAINKDPDAPIFSVADYGLVADIEAVLTEWESKTA